jgi:hypothetical protein
MSRTSIILSSFLIVAITVPAHTAFAQDAKATRPPTCAGGVKLYSGWQDVPSPRDTLKLPKLDKSVTTDGGLTMVPIKDLPAGAVQMPADQIVSNTKFRASTVGATGLVEELSTVNGRNVRRYTPIFASADSLHTAQVCHGKQP